jgi:hypothetical protein
LRSGDLLICNKEAASASVITGRFVFSVKITISRVQKYTLCTIAQTNNYTSINNHHTDLVKKYPIIF